MNPLGRGQQLRVALTPVAGSAAGLIWTPPPLGAPALGVSGSRGEGQIPSWGHFSGVVSAFFFPTHFLFFNDNGDVWALPHLACWSCPGPACPPFVLVGEPQVLNSPFMCGKLMVSDVNITCCNCSSVHFFVGGGQGGVPEGRAQGFGVLFCFRFSKKKKEEKKKEKQGWVCFLKNCLGYPI